VLLDRYNMRELVIGYDHGLGRGREGDAATLTDHGKRRGFRVEVVSAALDGTGVPVSSSAIRTAVAHGALEPARRLLGRPYGFRGVVVPGQQRGRALGYPTMNIELASPRKLLPPEGVYAVRAQMARGTRHVRWDDEPRSASNLRGSRALVRGPSVRRCRRLVW
jgi:riboflavin kinase/FMN adenylyltransferase